MKIQLTKRGMTRWCQESELELMQSAGWQTAVNENKAGEEIIRLKPPVKSRATAQRALEEANIDKGDE